MTYRAAPGDGVVWITGASSGIGRAVALALAQKGFTVVASARRAEELAALSSESGGRIKPYPLDVADREATRAAPAAIEAAHGPIALAFFNAGVAPYTRAGALDPGAFDKAFAVNVFGVVEPLASLLPLMFARKKGQVAINASLAGYNGLPRAAAYGASKAALINLGESLKFDCDLNNVTLQIVNPGFVDTPLTRKNDFPMPFIVTMQQASDAIVSGFERGGFEIAFPFFFSRIMKLIGLLPYALYFWIVAKTTGWSGRKE